MNLTSTEYPVKVGRLARAIMRAGVLICCVAAGMVGFSLLHHLANL